MDTYVARQPILDCREKIFAYELLFREGRENAYHAENGDEATSDVIRNSFLSIGMETLTGGKRGFINFTGNLLKNQMAYALPSKYVVIEILENIEPDPGIVEACQALKKAGYLLALDDFVFQPKFKPLIDLADIIKVDFLSSDVKERKLIVQRMGSRDIKFLAEKVETRLDFIQGQGVQLGYSYFQGYYFCKPVVVSGQTIPALKFNCLRLLQEINNPETNLDQIDTLIKGDVSLSYNLLEFINSPIFGLRSKIRNIKQALALLGIEEVRKWACIVSLRNLGTDKTSELVVHSVVRATFGEALAQKTDLREQASDIFLMGMLSMIDAFLDRPLAVILSELPLTVEIKRALLGEDNRFRAIFDLVLAYEKADWTHVGKYARQMKVSEALVAQLYIQALTSANKLVSFIEN